MIFDRRGEAAPGFHALGIAHTPAYLIDAPRPVLVDSGMAHLAGAYIADAREALKGRSPEILFHTHMHFDHCGSSAAMREAFPGIRLAASEAGAKIIARPGALKVIRELSDQARASLGRPGDGGVFSPFEVDTIVHDGDRFDLGDGQSLLAIATPGHTRDFMSYYVPERKILVASEAVGCAHESDKIMVEFVADYDSYLASLEKLMALEVEVLCQGHVFIYTGEDVRRFLEASLAATLRYRARAEELMVEEEGDVSAVAARIKSEDWDPLPWPKQPEAAYILNTEGRVRSIANLIRRSQTGPETTGVSR